MCPACMALPASFREVRTARVQVPLGNSGSTSVPPNSLAYSLSASGAGTPFEIRSAIDSPAAEGGEQLRQLFFV